MNRGSRTKIQGFTDLRAWQEGHALVLAIYQATKHFPREELFALVSQMRRAAVSVTSNIAEGFGRHSYKEKIQFYYTAHGSLTELMNQVIIARDVGYIDGRLYNTISTQAQATQRLLQGLAKKSKTFV